MAPIATTTITPQASTNREALPKILLLDEVHLAKDELAELQGKATVLLSKAVSRAQLMAMFAPGGEYDDIAGIYRHFGAGRSVKLTGRFDAELVAALPKSMRFIVHNGAGYDQLDVAALSSRNIQASNVPQAVDDATSDIALFLLLGALRRIPAAQLQLAQGYFNSHFASTSARDPRGKVLGIVGAGGIGRALAYKASHALGMSVIYHNRRPLTMEEEEAAAKGGMAYVPTLEGLLERADVVSLHCPLTQETRGLIGRAQLARMKPSAVLINTARGAIVKEEELAEALENSVIGGAGLDVYEVEPAVHARLVAQKDKVLLLPHIGTLTYETQREMEAVCLRNLIAGLDTGRLKFTVPEQQSVCFQ
ncbi:hypothetical protein FA10DRAFT_296259 [Acaromyces ingoldii]|uniref:2-hydroxyacid dehydrogenase n=1 Tax=Acaromyces ingoldii TaxID=215250 RepID=A0A316YL54_9BASI|nr:hypothetical protein FA10DRAFT_296259 [Acaromyces ingoldii]PWN88793.1 hypothetical protein FA10DRAFT_296259 [Acaromyces ingoldii]